MRTALERPDAITGSATAARDEIGRAIAARIRELRTDDDLKEVVEDVLPQVEKFLESPEERRSRRSRQGIMTSSVGVAAILSFLLVLLTYQPIMGQLLITLMGLSGGIVMLVVGLGIIIGARWFTVIPRRMESPQSISKQIISDEISTGSLAKEPTPAQPSYAPSVTEGTTRQLE